VKGESEEKRGREGERKRERERGHKPLLQDGTALEGTELGTLSNTLPVSPLSFSLSLSSLLLLIASVSLTNLSLSLSTSNSGVTSSISLSFLLFSFFSRRIFFRCFSAAASI